MRPSRLPPSSGRSSSTTPFKRFRSSSSFFSYFWSWSPHSLSACSTIDFERRLTYFLTCAITQLVGQAQLGRRHPVGVVVVGDEDLRAKLLGRSEERRVGK